MRSNSSSLYPSAMWLMIEDGRLWERNSFMEVMNSPSSMPASGQTEGVYQPSAALSRVGVAAIASLALWVAGYFAIGIAVVNG